MTTLRSALASSLASAATEARRRRLQIATLSPPARRIARVSLVAAFVCSVLVLGIPLGVDLPGGSITILREDSPTIPRLHLLASLLATALAFAAIALAAVRPGWRLGRLTLVGIAAAGLIVTPATLAGGPLLILISVSGVACALSLAALALVGRGLESRIVAPLGAAPPLLAIANLLAAHTTAAPLGVEQNLAGQIDLGIGGIQALFIVMALWAAIEYSRVLVAGSAVAMTRPRASWIILGVVTVKALLVLVTALQLLPAAMLPPVNPFELWQQQILLNWVMAVLFCVGMAWWLLRPRERGLSADGATIAAWIVGVPLVAAYTLPSLLLVAVAVPERFGLDLATPLIKSGYFSTTQDILLALTPVGAALVALMVGISIVRFGQKRYLSIGYFLLAFAAWTVVPATAFAVMRLTTLPLATPTGGVPGNVPLLVLDLGVTVVVVALLIAWHMGLQRSAPPGILLVVLLASTLISYGSIAFAEPMKTVIFWLALSFPVVVQFLFDAAALNRPGSKREARVLGTLGLAVLGTALLLPLLSLGFVGPDRVPIGDVFRVFIVVPFTAVLLAAVIGEQRERGAASGT